MKLQTQIPPSHIPRRRFLHILGGISSCAIPFSLATARPHSQLFRWDGAVLGAQASMTLQAENRQHAQSLTAECLKMARSLEAIFSLHLPHSSIRKLNREGRLLNPPVELLHVLRAAHQLSSLSKGAFDVSIQPLWKYLYYNNRQHSSEVAKAHSLVDYRRIHIGSDKIAFERKGMEITLNGIAQGYITERIAQLLRSRGMQHVLVDFGEMHAIGKKNARQPWKVGIKNPNKSEPFTLIHLENKAIATSARYGLQMANGHSHLLNPTQPKDFERYQSLSVIADSAMDADGLSTTLSLLDQKYHPSVLRHYPGATTRIF